MYKSQALYLRTNPIEFDISLGWVRWNECGVGFKFYHNMEPSGLRKLGRFNYEELLFWNILWFNGHFKLSHGRKDDRTVKPSLTWVKYGNLPAERKKLWS
jgi:hypothetical protein